MPFLVKWLGAVALLAMVLPASSLYEDQVGLSVDATVRPGLGVVGGIEKNHLAENRWDVVDESEVSTPSIGIPFGCSCIVQTQPARPCRALLLGIDDGRCNSFLHSSLLLPP